MSGLEYYNYHCTTSIGAGLVMQIYCQPAIARYAPEETQKERIARIAKEKMYASWVMYNAITMTMKKFIRVLNPKPHKQYYAQV